MSPRKVLSAKLLRVDAMAREGATLAQIAASLNVPEMVLISLAEKYLTGRPSKHGYCRALTHAARTLGITPAQAMSRILAAAFE